MRSLGWVLIQSNWCPYRKSRFGYREGSVSTEERPSEDTEKVAIHKLRREDSEETNSADVLILDIKPSEM